MNLQPNFMPLTRLTRLSGLVPYSERLPWSSTGDLNAALALNLRDLLTEQTTMLICLTTSVFPLKLVLDVLLWAYSQTKVQVIIARTSLPVLHMESAKSHQLRLSGHISALTITRDVSVLHGILLTLLALGPQ